MTPHVARITDVGQLRTHLLAFRRARQLTQADLAAELGLTKQRISTIESAPERITVGQFLTVLRALRVEMHLVAPEPPGPATTDLADW